MKKWERRERDTCVRLAVLWKSSWHREADFLLWSLGKGHIGSLPAEERSEKTLELVVEAYAFSPRILGEGAEESL